VWVDKAIKAGGDYLQKIEGPTGTWAPKVDDPHAVAYAALPGLTLLECGVSPKEPAIKAAAAFVRTAAQGADSSYKLDYTYDLALTILFLDKLGEARDRALIQTLILRLVAGQTSTGGWSYRCPVLTRAQLETLLKMLRATPEQLAKMPWSPVKALPVLSDPGKILVDPVEKVEQPINGTTDNSNSQFALLAMWTAQHHDVPMERTLNLLVTRYRASQNADGTWGYRFKQNGGEGGSPAMTCCGLLGMAVAHGLAHDAAEKAQRRQIAEAAQVLAGLAASPAAPGVAPAAVLALPVQAGAPQAPAAALAKVPLANDPMVIKGFAFLSQVVGKPTGRFLPPIKQENLYFLWSLERVGVLYDLSLIGDKDWYRWGAEILIANQDPVVGNWKDGGYPGANPVIDTCLALLFLKRVNLVADLKGKLPAQPDDLNKAVLKATDPGPGSHADSDKKEADVPPATPPPSAAPPETPVKPTPDPAPAPHRAEEPAPPASGLRILPWLLLGAALLLLTGGAVLVVVSRLARKPEPAAPRRKRRKGGSANGARKATHRREEV
jgi:hypothetical protein